MKILLIAVLIIYFISIYPSYYFSRIISDTFLQMVDWNKLNNDKRDILMHSCKRMNIEMAVTPLVNTLSVYIFMMMPIDAVQRYVEFRLKHMDIDTVVNDMFDDDDE